MWVSLFAAAKESPESYLSDVCSSRLGLKTYFLRAHNVVNRHTGKPELSMTKFGDAFTSAHVCVDNDATWTSPISL